MAVNKLALIRYKTIDQCLQNRRRKWTLEDLIEKVSEAIYEFEGIENGVSRRTLQNDLQLMRSDKLGYNAPIIVVDKKYYTYEDAKYSIGNVPISTADMDKMKEIVSVLKHLNGFNYFDEMSEMIAKLEDNIFKSKNEGKAYIQFESNQHLKGIHYITPLHQAIRNKTPLLIKYKSFKAQEASQAVYYPYLLKEYRNRWFIITKRKGKKELMTLALDRIEEFYELAKEPFVEYEGVDFERYYTDLLGVTKSEKDRGHKIVLFFDKATAPYILTKPIHHSQTVLKEDENGLLIRLDLVINFELEKEILAFGECVKVLGPRFLKSRIETRLKKALKQYEKVEKEKEELIS